MLGISRNFALVFFFQVHGNAYGYGLLYPGYNYLKSKRKIGNKKRIHSISSKIIPM